MKKFWNAVNGYTSFFTAFPDEMVYGGTRAPTYRVIMAQIESELDALMTSDNVQQVVVGEKFPRHVGPKVGRVAAGIRRRPLFILQSTKTSARARR